MSKIFVIIENNIVINTTIANDPLDNNWIDVTNVIPQPGIGWEYINEIFIKPVIPEVIIPRKIIFSKLEFLNLFTQTELETFYTAAKSSVPLEIAKDKMMVAENIDITNSQTIMLVNVLEQIGILGEGRANEILT